MDSRAPLIASIVLIAVMEAVSLIAWPLIPAGPVAVHFNIHGQPDGFASPWLALSVMPVLAIAITILFAVAPRLGGRPGNRLLPRAKGWIAVWVGSVLVLSIAHVMIVLRARGTQVDVAGTALFSAALLLMVAGNFMGKMPPNDWAGIRTPWTRASDYAWEKTNRLGGRMFVVVGFVTLATTVAGDKQSAFHVLLAGMAAMLLLFPVSRYYWKHDPERGD